MLCAASAKPHTYEEVAATRIQAHFRGRRARIKALKRRYRATNARRSHDSKGSDPEALASVEQDGTPGIASASTPDAHDGSLSVDTSSNALHKRAHWEEAEVRETLTGSKSEVSTAHLFPMQTARTDYVSLRREMEVRHTMIPPRLHRLRISTYLLLDEPRSSRSAQVISVLLLVMIMVSIICFMIETMPELKHVSKETWMLIEVFCTAVFTLEYVTRLSVCTVSGKSVWQFIKNPMNLVDLFAILPFYLWVAMRSLQMAKALGVLRTVRLVRLFRIFKLGRYSSGLQLMAEALRKSSQALSVLSFFLCIGIVLFSSAVYYVEKLGCPDKEELENEQLKGKGNQTEWDAYVSECRISKDGWHQQHGLCCDEHGSPLDFPSIVDTFWWATVTMTTVGFGEVYPRTEPGRLIAEATMLSGILLIALPVAIIGREFQKAYDKHHKADYRGSESARVYKFEGNFQAVPSATTVGTIVTGASRTTKKEKKENAQNTIDQGPSLFEMGRRLRLMKLGGDGMASIMQELAEDFEEAGDLEKEIWSMSKVERSRQSDVVDQFETVLKRFRELQEGADGQAKKAKSVRSLHKGLAGIVMRARTRADLGQPNEVARSISDPSPINLPKPISSEIISVVPSPVVDPPQPPPNEAPQEVG